MRKLNYIINFYTHTHAQNQIVFQRFYLTENLELSHQVFRCSFAIKLGIFLL